MKRYLQRGWWKPWNWSTRKWSRVLLVTMVISPAISRWICLWQIPDVSVPFDVQQFVGPAVPKDQDAVTRYTAAARMLDESRPEWLLRAMDDATDLNSQWDERLDQWLLDNSKLLDELELGSSRDSVSKSRSRNDEFNVSLSQDLRNLSRVSKTQTRAFERSGNLDDAWKWHRVSLRLVEHTDKMESLSSTLVGMAVLSGVLESIRRWASHPSLTAEQLRRARIELTQLTSHRTPISQIMKSNYLESKNVLESEYGPDILFPELENSLFARVSESNLSRFFLSNAKQLYSWSRGQPELSLRFLRQIVVNNLDQIDQPLHQRQQIVRRKYPIVFKLNSGQPQQSGQLSATQLDRELDGPLGRRLIEMGQFSLLGQFQSNGGSGCFEECYLNYNAKVTMTIVVLAAQEFHRVHGKFPTDIKQLSPDYLETEPLDPMSRKGEALRYRVDGSGNGWVWTVGTDEPNESASAEENAESEQCYKIMLKEDVQPSLGDLIRQIP